MNNKKRGDKLSVSESLDRIALQHKINMYSDVLYKIAFLQLRNNQDAEDVVQETFYQFIKRNSEFESLDHEKAWLIKVTLNGCRKIWRSAWHRHTESMPEKEVFSESSYSSLENAFLKREENRGVLEAVMKLPRKYRDVIHLFYFEQMSIKEICLITDRKESTVTSQLTRGRNLLKKYLKEVYQYE